MTVRRLLRWLMLIAAVSLVVVYANPRWRDSFSHFLRKEGVMTGYHRFSPESFYSGSQLALGQAIYAGDLPTVEKLAKTVDLNVHGQRDVSLLMFAVNQATADEAKTYGVRFQIVAALVKAGADINDSNSSKENATPLSIALQAISPNYLRALLDGGMSPDYMIDGQEPIIFQVAHDPLLALVKLLVARGANVNARDVLGQTAIFNALSTAQLDVVNYLLDHGADPNVVDHLGFRFTYDLSQAIDRQTDDNPYHFKPRMIAIRDRLIKQGVKWPPDPPAVERDRMRARGETPVIPDGLAR